MRPFRRRHAVGERGAVAVEFALIVPVLVLMIVGMIEFARAYNVQISLTNAAREAARTMAIHDDPAAARSAGIAAAPSLNPSLSGGQISISPASCAGSPNGTVKVTINYNLTLITGLFGVQIPLKAVGVMLCGG